MKKSECCKKIAAGLICVCVFLRTSDVFAIAATNPEGTKHNFKTFLNNLKNGVYLQKGMEYMGKGTAAIGDPLGTVSEYVDKDKLERLEKVKEKYEKYKKDYEKYKKEYEEYKAWAKEQYAATQQLANDAMSAVDTVKSTAEMAKNLPGSVGGIVDSAKGQLNGAIGSVTGEINSVAGSVGVDASGVTDSLTGKGSSGSNQKTSDNAGAVTNASVSNQAGSNVNGGQYLSQSGVSNAGVPSSSRQAFATNTAQSSEASSLISSNPISGVRGGASSGVTQAVNVVSSSAVAAEGGSSVNNVRSNIKAAVSANRSMQNVSSVAGEIQIERAAFPISDVQKQTLTPAVAQKAVRADTNIVKNTQRIDTQKAIAKKTIQKQNIETLQPVKTQIRRKTFKNLEKQSLFQKGEMMRLARISHSEPMAFALFGAAMPDGGTDQNGNVLVSPTIGLVKGISSDDARKAGAMDKILMEMNDSLKGAQVGKEEVGSYLLQGKRELVAAYIGEAYKTQKEIEDFGEKVVNSLETAPSNNEIDQYGNINEMNKALVKAMNGFLRTKASKLMQDSYENYMMFGFSSPEQEDDEG